MKVARASALTLGLLTLLVAAAACGSGGGKQVDTAEARAVLHWRAGLVRWNRQMIAALNGLSVLFSEPGPVARLAASDPATGAKFASLDETLADCSARVSALGPAPPGLEVAHDIALRACVSLERGARLARAGVSSLQRGLGSIALDRATEPLSTGQSELSAAATALRSPSP